MIQRSPKRVDNIDQIVRLDPVLQELSTLKQQLKNPSLFSQAAARLQALLDTVPVKPSEVKESPTPAVSSETDSETLERLLGSAAAGSTSQKPQSPDSQMGMDEMIRRVVSPHIMPENKHLNLYLDQVADLSSTPHSSEWDAVDPAALERWHALRNSTEARWISLALPRVLLRLPYGQETEPCERFPFREMPPKPEHETFLWGNPSFACAIAFIESCHAQEQGFPTAAYTDLEDLPASTYRDGGASVMHACAEVYLSERSGRKIGDYGCIPLYSYKNGNSLRVGPLLTLATTTIPSTA